MYSQAMTHSNSSQLNYVLLFSTLSYTLTESSIYSLHRYYLPVQQEDKKNNNAYSKRIVWGYMIYIYTPLLSTVRAAIASFYL